MFQSYKTNRCFPAADLVLLLLFACLPFTAKAGKKRQSHDWQQFRYYERTFIVPPHKRDEVWDYVEDHLNALPDEFSLENQANFSSRQYFDDPGQHLLKRDAALFSEVLFEKDNQKHRVNLWYKTDDHWQVVVFKENKKPDKGKKFTNQLLLKQLRAKDRAAFDSLARAWHVNPEKLQPFYETTQDQKHLIMLRNGKSWVSVVLSEVRSEAPAVQFLELSIIPDRRILTSASPRQRQQLLQFTDTLAISLKQRFPSLRPDNRNPYLKINFTRQTVPKGSRRYQALLAIALLVLLLLFYYVRNRKSK